MLFRFYQRNNKPFAAVPRANQYSTIKIQIKKVTKKKMECAIHFKLAVRVF